MIIPTFTYGIVPGDLLIREAIKAALADIKNNPWLLDYLLGWNLLDDLTSSIYGAKESKRAKDWFLNTEIFVTMNYRADDIKFPCISIALTGSTEDVSTLADVNSDTQENVPASEVTFNPQPSIVPVSINYNSTTGVVTIPDTTGIYSNMVLVDPSTNTGYVIQEVIDGQTFLIPTNVKASFAGGSIAPVSNFYITTIESCFFKNTYTIYCLAQGDPVYTLYLEQIVLFILLRYKQQLLELRGFERTILSSGPLYKYEETGVENVFGRDITLQGFIQHRWPKLISSPINGISIAGINILGGGTTPGGPPNWGWGMQNDDLTSF